MVNVHVSQQQRLDVVDWKIDLRIGILQCLFALKDPAVDQQALILVPKKLMAGACHAFMGAVMNKFHGADRGSEGI